MANIIRCGNAISQSEYPQGFVLRTGTFNTASTSVNVSNIIPLVALVNGVVTGPTTGAITLNANLTITKGTVTTRLVSAAYCGNVNNASFTNTVSNVPVDLGYIYNYDYNDMDNITELGVSTNYTNTSLKVTVIKWLEAL